jgi:hypothetical protein
MWDRGVAGTHGYASAVAVTIGKKAGKEYSESGDFV